MGGIKIYQTNNNTKASITKINHMEKVNYKDGIIHIKVILTKV